jgi:hypothetical protein
VSKKLLDAQPTKLARRQEAPPAAAEERPALSARRPAPRQPKSFRLSAADIARLQQLSATLTAEAGRPITQIDVLKGLLRLGEGADKRRLLSHIKDAYFEAV